MAVSMRDLDSAFQGAGQKPGLEVWRIENSRPCPVPKSSFGVFLTGDSYVILKTTALKCGGLHHVIHYWLGKDICKEEAGRAAIKAVELAAALGARAVQYREVQGHETELFLSYFRPCIIPQTVGAASGLKHAESEEYKTRLYVCKGKHVVRVKEVPFARSSLNHDDIFILDTKCKVFQFNGSNSSIQERAKALEVVKHIKDTYHDGKCEVAAIDDGKLMADLETGEFWGFFGGFAPLPRKTANDIDKSADASPKLFRIVEDHVESVLVDSLTRELHESNKCYILDCGLEVFIWMGRSSSIDERKSASRAAEELFSVHERPKCHIICIIEGFETVSFREKYDSWPQTTDMAIYEDGRGKVTALLRRQGVNVKGLLKTAPAREEPQPYIDCTGSLQVWRVNGQEKTLLSAHDQSKFYSGDCYIFQYAYLVEDKEEYLVGSWLGKQSIEDERISSISLARKMVESLKHPPAQARVYEGNEPVQFYAIFQRFIVFKGGISAGYKQYIAEKATKDDTYSEDCLALFRVQGSGPDDMQAIQVEPVASSLNSAYCYILHSGSSVFTWSGNLTTPDDQELVERLLDLIKPNVQSKPQKEGAESEQFWELLGGKSEYPNLKIKRETESEHHLFACSFSEGELKVTEIYNFTQDDLMTEDIYILDCYSEIFVWVGQQVNLKDRMLALTVGEKFVERDFLRENLSREVPLYIVMEGSEPPFFTRFFTWNSAKSMMHGNSFQRKFTILKNGGIPTHNKPKRRTPVSYGGRSGVPDKSQRSRSMSFSPERVRVRGRSPAFNALAATFENPNARNLSTPPPLVRKLYPKSVTPEAAKLASKSSAIAALGATYEKPPVRDALLPRSLKVSPEAPKVTPEANHKESPMSSRIEALTIQEDVKEGEAEDEDGLLIYPYIRLITTSMDPVADIDVTKRERYLSLGEFREKFGMEKDAFYKLPKWKQNKMKMALQLF